jgi:hypothetical protein
MDRSHADSPTGRPEENREAAPERELPDPRRWNALVAQIGAEIAEPLTSALERINALTNTGRIDRIGLRKLRDEVDLARHIGIVSQQLTRLATGRVRQSHERLQLADMFHGVLAHRSREVQSRGMSLSPLLNPVEVLADASLLFSLLNTTIDWALAHAQSHIQFGIDMLTWPEHGCLTCRFAHRPADDLLEDTDTTVAPALNCLSWRLLEQTAWAMRLVVSRKDTSHHAALSIEFPHTAASSLHRLAATDIDDGFSPSSNSQPLAGCQVLVVASRRDLRVQIRDALRQMNLILDFVNTVDEAVAFCQEGLPHAIVIESVQAGARFAAFRTELLSELPGFVFVEIVEPGFELAMADAEGSPAARVGRDVLATSLPAALIFELSKGL